MITKKDIQKAAAEFRNCYPEYETYEGSRGKSLEACIMFLSTMGMSHEDMADYIVTGQRSKGGREPAEEHHLVKIGMTHVDPSVRQYREDAPFPMMWDYPSLRRN